MKLFRNEYYGINRYIQPWITTLHDSMNDNSKRVKCRKSIGLDGLLFGSIASGVSSLFRKSTRSKQLSPVSKDDDLTKLIHLQMANGSFKFGQVFQDLIGMTESQIMEKFHETEVDGIWITAVALELLEKKFPQDKELWELIAKKAKIFIQTNAKAHFDDIMMKAKESLV